LLCFERFRTTNFEKKTATKIYFCCSNVQEPVEDKIPTGSAERQTDPDSQDGQHDGGFI